MLYVYTTLGWVDELINCCLEVEWVIIFFSSETIYIIRKRMYVCLKLTL